MHPDEAALTPTPKPYPGFAQALLVVFLFFLFTTVLTLPAAILSHLKRPGWAAWLLFMGQLGGTYLTLLVCLPMGRKTWADAIPNGPVALAVWPCTLIVTVGLMLIVNGVDGWLSHVIPPPAWFRQMFTAMGWPSVVLGAPLTEESLFRGLILGGFVLRYGTRRAIAYSALLFAFIHLNPWQFPTGLLVGAFLAWLTLRTRSLWPAVFAHFLNNLVVTFAHAHHIPYLSDERFQPFWMWGLGFLLAGFGMVMLFRISQRQPCLGEAPCAFA